MSDLVYYTKSLFSIDFYFGIAPKIFPDSSAGLISDYRCEPDIESGIVMTQRDNLKNAIEEEPVEFRPIKFLIVVEGNISLILVVFISLIVRLCADIQDDSELNRKIVRRIIESSRQFEAAVIREADDGLSALAAAREEASLSRPPFDFILMDYTMVRRPNATIDYYQL